MPETPKQIVRILEKVKRKEDALGPLFERMDRDWRLYNLEKFMPREDEGIDIEDAFTSNRPRVFADKLIGAIAGAKQIVRVAMDADNQEERDVNNDYERLGIGFLKIADDNLVDGGGVPLRTNLGTYVITEGGYAAARALLRKDSDGSTIVDVKPIDPRHLLIQHGDREPVWAAIVTLRDRGRIRDEYPDFKFDDDPLPGENSDNERTEKVVDYYWKENGKYMNAVIIAEKWAMKKKDTFAKRFPIVARAVGGHSVKSGALSLSENNGGSNIVPGVETFAESAFAPIRSINAFKNRLMSYDVALTARDVRQVMVVESSGGTKEVPDDLQDSAGVNLDVDNNEKIYPLEYKETRRNVERALAELNVEEADGSLPEQSYGRLPAPISGNALQILGASVGERLEPFIRPIESCIEGVIEALASQYETGRYRPIKVQGKTRDRKGFARVIQPRDIKGRDRIMVELEPRLPQDENQKWLTAQIATTPGANGMPLASHMTVWEDVLKLQDADLQNERIHAQMARTSMPKMLLMTQFVAATQSGDEETAGFLRQELERIINREAMEEMAQKVAFLTMLMQNPLAAAAAGGGEQNGAGGQNSAGTPRSPTSGIDPTFAALAGVAPGSIQPSPEAGANTTGPRSTEERANAIGITLARS